MRPIFVVLLALQVALLLTCAWTVGVRKPTSARPKPVWSSLIISTIVAAGASFSFADRHVHDVGSELVRFGGAVLLGLGIGFALMSLRERRGLDRLESST